MGNCFNNQNNENNKPNNKPNDKVIIKSRQLKVSSHYTVNYPTHEKRKNSALYNRTHRELCYTKNIGCFICGKNNKDNKISTETHHFYIEKVGTNAIDWHKFGKFASSCYNIQTGEFLGDKFDWEKVAENPEIFVDSKYNMVVLCKEHHISGTKGVHHVPFPDWVLQKFAKDNYEFLT